MYHILETSSDVVVLHVDNLGNDTNDLGVSFVNPNLTVDDDLPSPEGVHLPDANTIFAQHCGHLVGNSRVLAHVQRWWSHNRQLPSLAYLHFVHNREGQCAPYHCPTSDPYVDCVPYTVSRMCMHTLCVCSCSHNKCSVENKRDGCQDLLAWCLTVVDKWTTDTSNYQRLHHVQDPYKQYILYSYLVHWPSDCSMAVEHLQESFVNACKSPSDKWLRFVWQTVGANGVCDSILLQSALILQEPTAFPVLPGRSTVFSIRRAILHQESDSDLSSQLLASGIDGVTLSRSLPAISIASWKAILWDVPLTIGTASPSSLTIATGHWCDPSPSNLFLCDEAVIVPCPWRCVACLQDKDTHGRTCSHYLYSNGP